MKVFLTGSEGYIGTLLAPILLERGHEVIGLDTGYYREGWLFNDRSLVPGSPRWLNKDLREITPADLDGVDAVVHLAELSNDPLGQNNPETTYAINYHGTLALAEAAQAAGVPRFVYTSSCSVYGAGSGDFLDEQAPTNPQTAYAECKVLVERDLGAMASDTFTPTFLRNATAFGPSPRMRFDIVLNNLAGLASAYGRIAMVSDGMPWRPLVHVLDACKAIRCSLEAPRETVHNEVFNVGSNGANYRVREVAEIVSETFPGCELTLGRNDGDNRSYRVSFDKIHAQLPGFACDYDARDGARQLHDVFTRIDLGAAGFEARPFTRLEQLKHLIRTGQVDDQLFWQTEGDATALAAKAPLASAGGQTG